jgi:hypothetical protein
MRNVNHIQDSQKDWKLCDHCFMYFPVNSATSPNQGVSSMKMESPLPKVRELLAMYFKSAL